MPDLTAKLRQRVYDFNHRWGVLTLIGLLIAAFWVCIAIWSKHQEAATLEASRRELVQLNLAVNQQAEGLFKTVEASMRLLDHWLTANPRIDPLTDPKFAAVAEDIRRTSDNLVDPRMVTHDGKLFYIPTLDRKPRAHVADRAYFREQVEHPERRELFISEPVISRVTKKWGIPISWRLEHAIGGIQVLFANVEMDRLSVIHERIRKKPSGTITLLRDDGMVLSRTPFSEKIIGHSLSNTQNFKTQFGAHNSGAFVSESSATDGVRRMITYSRLSSYPVILLVTEGYDDMLADWRTQRNQLLFAAVFITLAIIVAALLLQRSLRATSIAQNEMRVLATTDSLTGVMNRRMMLDLAQREFSRAWRYGRPLAVLALDIDHFKKVNDTYGHSSGDIVLRECAAAWRAALRDQDLFGRMGGEEFCALLPETPADVARDVAERLREVIRKLTFPDLPSGFSASVSIGLTSISRSDEQLAQLLERADRALYTAKDRGRNRVECLDRPPAQSGAGMRTA